MATTYTPEQQAARDALKKKKIAQKTSGMTNTDILRDSASKKGVDMDRYDAGYQAKPAATQETKTSGYTPGTDWEEFMGAQLAQDPVNKTELYEGYLDDFESAVPEKVNEMFDTPAWQGYLDYTSKGKQEAQEAGDKRIGTAKELYDIGQGLLDNRKEGIEGRTQTQLDQVDNFMKQYLTGLTKQKADLDAFYEGEKGDIDAEYGDREKRAEESYKEVQTDLLTYLRRQGMKGSSEDIAKQSKLFQNKEDMVDGILSEKARRLKTLSAEQKNSIDYFDEQYNNKVEEFGNKKQTILDDKSALLEDLEDLKFSNYSQYVTGVDKILDDTRKELSGLDQDLYAALRERDADIISVTRDELFRAEEKAGKFADMQEEDVYAQRLAELYKDEFPAYQEAQQEALEIERELEFEKYVQDQWAAAEDRSATTGYVYSVNPDTGEIYPTNEHTLARDKALWAAKKSSGGGDSSSGFASLFNGEEGTGSQYLSYLSERMAGYMQQFEQDGDQMAYDENIQYLVDEVQNMFPQKERGEIMELLTSGAQSSLNEGAQDAYISGLNEMAEEKGIPGFDPTKDPNAEADRIENAPSPPGWWDNLTSNLSTPSAPSASSGQSRGSIPGVANSIWDVTQDLYGSVPGVGKSMWNTLKSIKNSLY